jgi:hypothetical protein
MMYSPKKVLIRSNICRIRFKKKAVRKIGRAVQQECRVIFYDVLAEKSADPLKYLPYSFQKKSGPNL